MSMALIEGKRLLIPPTKLPSEVLYRQKTLPWITFPWKEAIDFWETQFVKCSRCQKWARLKYKKRGQYLYAYVKHYSSRLYSLKKGDYYNGSRKSKPKAYTTHYYRWPFLGDRRASSHSDHPKNRCYNPEAKNYWPNEIGKA